MANDYVVKQVFLEPMFDLNIGMCDRTVEEDLCEIIDRAESAALPIFTHYNGKVGTARDLFLDEDSYFVAKVTILTEYSEWSFMLYDLPTGLCVFAE